MGRYGLIWVLFGACLVLSFILSGMEAGVFALSRLRIRQQMRAGKRTAQVLHNYLEHPENFLWTILVGNTVANFIIFGWMIVILHGALRGHVGRFVLLFSGAVFLFYVLFDLLPKMLFRSFPNRLCLMLARPFGIVHFVLRPLVAVVEWVSRMLLRWSGGKTFTGHLFGNREELRLVMQESAQAFSSEERAMINRVLDLQSLTVRQAMKLFPPDGRVSMDTPVSEVLAIGRQTQAIRMPVWEKRENRQRIAGLVNVNGLLFNSNLEPNRRMADFLQPALFVDEDMRVEVALRRMQRSGQRLAVVLGRDGRELGTLDLQDVLEVIFGEVSL
jgi:CBS domain containing-hemolysin-like protein